MNNKFWLGKHHTEETKKKMSEKRKKLFKEGKIINHKGMFGKLHTKEWKENMSKIMKGRKITWGNKISLVKKGISNPKLSETKKRLYKEGKLIPPNKNKIFSEEHKRKIGLGNKGKKLSEETKRNISLSNKGKSKQKLSETLKIKYKYGNLPKCIGAKGKDNLMWNNGSSFEPYSLDWTKEKRLGIKKRDDFTCQLCGDKITERRRIKNNPSKNWLTIHHIDYNKKNCNDNNLITLCHFCNVSVNTLREEWTKYFQDRVGGL